MSAILRLPRTVRILAVSIAVWVLLLPAGSPAAEVSVASMPLPRPPEVAPGVSYFAIIDDVGAMHAHVLRYDPSQGASLVAIPAGMQLPAAVPTVTMLERADVVAGINGDFMKYARRSPTQAFATHGDLLQTRTDGVSDELLGITEAGVAPVLGQTELQLELDDPTTAAHWPIDGLNQGTRRAGSLGDDEILAYTSYGGTVSMPLPATCSARLVDATPSRWADVGRSGISRSYIVGRVACSKDRMELRGGLVLSAKRSGTMTETILALGVGTTVSIEWSLEGWSNVTGLIGGNQLILDEGRNMVDPSCSTYTCNRNARTGVGIQADGSVLMVVVDQRGGSRGISLYDYAELFRDLGAVSAINLDGNGSSTMYVNGRTVNRPSDPGRRVSSALGILEGADPDLNIAPAI